MMNQIKHGISFIMGVLYSSMVWLLFRGLGWNVETWVLLTALLIVTLLIVILIIKFFVTHWRKH